MAAVVTISNPAYNLSGGATGASSTVPCEIIEIEEEFGSVRKCTLKIRSNIYDRYKLNILTNCLQLNSRVTVTLNGITWFKGFILNKPSTKDPDGDTMSVYCLGAEGILLQSFCNYTSEQSWTIQTDWKALDDLPLIATSDYGSFDGDTLWADPADSNGAKCWIQDSDCPNDLLDTTINAGATELILSIANKGFSPIGFLKIDSEWIIYSGNDNANTDDKFRCHNLVRGALGTTAASHTAGATVYNKISKQIAPQPIELQNDPGTGWERLTFGSEYTVNHVIGCFALADAAVGSYKADVSFYDEDGTLGGTNRYSVEDVIQRIVTADATYGGAGFDAPDCDFDTTNPLNEKSSLMITRYDYDPEEKPEMAWEAISDFIESLDLGDALKFWYDQKNEKFRLAIIGNGTPALTINKAQKHDDEDSLENCFSGIRVSYTDFQTLNRATASRAYHPATNGVTASPLNPTSWWKVPKNGSGYIIPGDAVEVTAAGSDGLELCCDGNVDSKFVGAWENLNPAGTVIHSDWTFKDAIGGIPDKIRLNKLRLRAGTYRAIEGWGRSYTDPDNMYVIRLLGCLDYDISTHESTSSIWTTLAEFRNTANEYGGAFDETIENFPLNEVNCVRIVFDYMPGRKEYGDYYWASIHDFEVEGDTTKYVYVQISDTIDDDPLFVKVSTETFRQLRGGIEASAIKTGCPRSDSHPIGANTYNGAISVARLLLISNLIEWDQRTYTTREILSTRTELGDTIAIGTEYTGVVMGQRFVISHEDVESTYRLKNWAVSRIGE